MEIRKSKTSHNVRGFLKEYSIIVLSVLTALGLEQAVVWIHHRSDVKQAIANLRAESIQNRATLTFSIANMRDQVKAVDARLQILGNCAAQVDDGKLAALSPSTTLLPSDTAWLGLRDSALLPLMPKEIADNYWKLNTAYTLMVPDLEDVIGKTDDALAAVDLVRRGVKDPQACIDAVHRLLRMRASLKTLWRQLVFYQSGNEQVLHGDRLGVGSAMQAVRDASASLKEH
ncbi:MAG: hypothetical protein WBV39_14140 [Rudaea sp.]